MHCIPSIPVKGSVQRVVILKSNFFYKKLLSRLWLPMSPPENSNENILETLIQKAEKSQAHQNDEQSTLIHPMKYLKQLISPCSEAQRYNQKLETKVLQ